MGEETSGKNLEVISQGPAAKKLLFFVTTNSFRAHQGAFCYMQGGQTGGRGLLSDRKKMIFVSPIRPSPIVLSSTM